MHVAWSNIAKQGVKTDSSIVATIKQISISFSSIDAESTHCRMVY